jgi:hypothetical protein
VIGPRGSGKSTFVQRVLDLEEPSVSAFSIKHASLDGVVVLLRFIEIRLEDMGVTTDFPVSWPAFVLEAKSRIDGAFLLWDVTEGYSESEILDVLSKFGELLFRPCCAWVSFDDDQVRIIVWLDLMTSEAEIVYIRTPFQGCDSNHACVYQV